MTYTPSLKSDSKRLIPVGIIGLIAVVVIFLRGGDCWPLLGALIGAPIGLYIQYVTRNPCLSFISETELRVTRLRGNEEKIDLDSIESAAIFTRFIRYTRVYLKTPSGEIYFRIIGFSPKQSKEILKLLCDHSTSRGKPVTVDRKAEPGRPATAAELHG